MRVNKIEKKKNKTAGELYPPDLKIILCKRNYTCTTFAS